MEGYVHSFESLAAVDGIGLRCAVFLQGCPLRCAYCHNPDTWEALKINPTEPKSLADKIGRYKPYFGEGGGVTFSGGEPLLQARFIYEVSRYLNEKDIKYIIDTSGVVPPDDCVKKVLSNSQLVILDYKFPCESMYQKYVGASMKNMLLTLDFLESIGKETWVRTVVVPGVNDTKEAISQYLPLIKSKKCIKKYELLPFHTLGFFKYEKAGLKNPFADKSALEQDVLEELRQFVESEL